MTNVTYVKQQKAKAKFIGLYILSLALVFVVAVAFQQSQTATTPPEKKENNTEKYFLQADTLLHQKSEAFDVAYAAYLNGDIKKTEEMNVANKTLTAVLDSMDKVLATLTDASQKQMLHLAVNRFRKTAENRNVFLKHLSQLANNTDTATKEKNPVTQPQPENSDVLTTLKQMLVEKENKIAALENQQQQDLQEKDKLITSLQNQLKQKGATMQNHPAVVETEWKQKYETIKANYEKVVIRENDLKAAYKTIVEDNRRLLNQIQNLKGNR